MMSLLPILLTLPLMLQGASPSSAHVVARPLTNEQFASSASRLDRSLVPGLAGKFRVERSQAFSVVTSKGSFWFEPVLYESSNPDTPNTSPRCGVFILREKEKSLFLPTLGYSWTEAETCTRLEGVGFLELGSEMPRILLLYAGSSPNYSTREPIVLDWNAASRLYQGNRDLSLALTHHDASASINSMKRRIEELRQQPPGR